MRTLLLAALLSSIALPFATGAVPLVDNHVLINEVIPNPTGSDDGFESFELYNPTATPVDVSGWSVTDNDYCFNAPGLYRLPSGSLVAPGGVLAVVIPSSAHICLSNSFGDDLSLYDDAGTFVDAVWYGNGGDFFPFAEKAIPVGTYQGQPYAYSGLSLSRCFVTNHAAELNVDGDNPRAEFFLDDREASENADGSPGALNAPCGLPALPAA